MATTNGKIHCVSCGKEKIAYRCEGCSQNYCVNHLADHHRDLGLQLIDVEHKRDLLRDKITEQTYNPRKQMLVQQINQWELDSLDLIRQTADEARQILSDYAVENISKVENNLEQLNKELKEVRDENDFNELHIKRFEEVLNKLEEELNKPSTIAIQYDCSPFIQRVSVTTSSVARLFIPNLNVDAKWAPNGITVAGGNGRGCAMNQLSHPFCAYIDDDQTIYVADRYNHRIVEWKHGETNGRVVAGGNGPGERNDQLNCPTIVVIDKENNSFIICDQGNQRIVRWPRQNGMNGEILVSHIDCYDLKIDNDGYFYVVDCNSHTIRRYRMNGANETIIAGGNGIGSGLNQLNQPRFIWIDQDHSLYVSDYGNHRIMKWTNGAKEGVVMAGGQGSGNCPGQLCNPRGIVVDQLETIYIADSGNFRVMRWCKGVTQGSVVVGENGQGKNANQFYNLRGLSFDREGNLYIVDTDNHRIQKFNIESNSTT